MIIFNYWTHEPIEVSEGELVCSKCNGEGIKKVLKDRPAQFNTRRICMKCQGVGKLDWIENIMGKPPLSASSSGGPSSPSISSCSYTTNEKKMKEIQLIRKANERVIRKRRNPVPEMQWNRGSRRKFPFARSSL